MKVIIDEYLPLRDVVFKTLREGILRGELEPGERLMEVALANKLGVSRTPIREAIRKLELEGLVKMIPRRGAQVASISEKNVRDVLEVRKSMEELAMTLAIMRITPEEIVELQEAAKEVERVIGTGDLTLIAQRDEAFHDVIYHATKNEKLVFLINNLREQMYRFRLEYIKDEQMRETLLKEHQMIVNALLQKDCDHGKAVVCLHIDNQEKTILKNLPTERENA